MQKRKTLSRVICMATGSFWRSFRNKNGADALKLMQKLPVNGVELTLGKREQFERFFLQNSHKQILQKLDYVSVHAPFRRAKNYSSLEELAAALNRVQEIAEEANAQTVVFHPSYLPPEKLLKKFRFKIALENMEKKRKVSLQQLANLARKHQLSFCLDASHAYEYGPLRTSALLKRFSHNLRQIHLSANYRHQNHQPLTRASPAFLQSIQPLKETTVPIVLEENFSDKSLSLAQKEIAWAKKFFETE